MTTETDLRTALLTRAADAPVLDPDRLLAELTHRTPPVRSVSGVSHGRRWAVAGVAAGVVALAAVPVAVIVHDDAGRGGTIAPGGVATAPTPPASTGATTDPAAAVAASEAAAQASAAASMATAASASAASGAASSAATNPYDASAPLPAASDWQNYAGVDTATPLDDSAIVFTDQDPIVAFYVRPHQQLSILAADATQKDNSDAVWHAAVQVSLAGSGFEPSSVDAPSTVTVNGISRMYGSLPRLLDVPGPAQVPSLVWRVGDAWVVLQIDTPEVPTVDQLAAAAARIDVHHG